MVLLYQSALGWLYYPRYIPVPTDRKSDPGEDYLAWPDLAIRSHWHPSLHTSDHLLGTGNPMGWKYLCLEVIAHHWSIHRCWSAFDHVLCCGVHASRHCHGSCTGDSQSLNRRKHDIHIPAFGRHDDCHLLSDDLVSSVERVFSHPRRYLHNSATSGTSRRQRYRSCFHSESRLLRTAHAAVVRPLRCWCRSTIYVGIGFRS